MTGKQDTHALPLLVADIIVGTHGAWVECMRKFTGRTGRTGSMTALVRLHYNLCMASGHITISVKMKEDLLLLLLGLGPGWAWGTECLSQVPCPLCALNTGLQAISSEH